MLWASKLFMTKGHTYYCGLIRGPYVEKLQQVVYYGVMFIVHT